MYNAINTQALRTVYDERITRALRNSTYSAHVSSPKLRRWLLRRPTLRIA